MINIVTNATRKDLTLEQRMRFVAVLVAAMATAFAVLCILLIPVHIFAGNELAALTRYTDLEKESRSLARKDNSLKTARAVTTQIEAAEIAKSNEVASAIEHILRTRATAAETITLTSFSYTTTNGEAVLKVSGATNTTRSVSDFSDALRRSGRFRDVALPVSDLADDKGTFSILLTLAK